MSVSARFSGYKRKYILINIYIQFNALDANIYIFILYLCIAFRESYNMGK